MRLLLSCVLVCVSIFSTPASAETKTETVILITIDGLRWQELFQGVDNAFFDQKEYIAYKKHHEDFKRAFWRNDVNERRTALMPFFWKTIQKEGQLYGNRDKGSNANLTNKFHFSYPGYSEILTGIADNERITSNDMLPNPNRTVLEFLNKMPENNGHVEAFGSWDVFPYILNREHSGIPVNAGFEPYVAHGDAKVTFLNELLMQIPSPWDTVRLDAFTMNYAHAALKREKMKFVYIALGETDDFAHEGFYDLYANAAHRSDKAIADLWSWLQNDVRYKGKTTLLITTDHGRGSDSLEAWKSHGRFPYKKEDGTDAISDFKGDDAVWMAVIGPDTPALGEVHGGPAIKLNQVAATTARFLGYKYKSDHAQSKAGLPIKEMLK